MRFEKPPRQAILDYIEKQGVSTISTISEQLKMEPKKVRYETLRLVQQHKLKMKIESNKREPFFSIMCE